MVPLLFFTYESSPGSNSKGVFFLGVSQLLYFIHQQPLIHPGATLQYE